MYSSFSVQQEACENVLLESAVLHVLYCQFLDLAYRQIIQISGMLVFWDVNLFTYLCTYLHTYMHRYLLTYILYIHTYLRTYIHTYLLTYLITYIHT